MRFEEDELDGEGEVTATHSGSYGYRYTSRTTGELSLEFDDGEACQLRLTFSGEGAGSYSYRCGGSSRGQGSFELSELLNRAPEITSIGPFEVEENHDGGGAAGGGGLGRGGRGYRLRESREEPTGRCLPLKERRES